MDSEPNTGTEAPEQAADDSQGGAIEDDLGLQIIDQIDAQLSELNDTSYDDEVPEVEATDDEVEGDEVVEEAAPEVADETGPALQALQTENAELKSQMATLMSKLDAVLEEKQSDPVEKPEPMVAEKAPEGSSPEQIIEFYVQKNVNAAVEKMVGERLKPIAPTLERNKFHDDMSDAFRGLLETGEIGAEFETPEAAKLVGMLVEGDDDLLHIAKIDPRRALRLASRQAKAALADEKVRKRDEKNKTVTPLKRRTSQGASGALPDPLNVAIKALAEARRGA